VLDSAAAEGAAVADLLGARDLDGWDGLLERSHGNRATASAAAALGRLGADWRLAAADRPPRRISTIEGRVLGQGQRRRAAVVDRSSPMWRAVESWVTDRPAWAALILAEGVANRMDLEPDVRDRWLADLARAAVDEGEERVQ
jgi:hypothetical protein